MQNIWSKIAFLVFLLAPITNTKIAKTYTSLLSYFFDLKVFE